MSMFDRLLNTVRLNDDYDDDDFYDDDDEILEDEPEKKEKVNSRFSKKMDDDMDLDEEPVKPKKKKFTKEKAAKPAKAEKAESSSFSSRSSKITPIRKAGNTIMEVCVIKPISMEETREIVDTLNEGCTVVLNLEGLDVETAQRIIDFVSGASYAIEGTLRMVSSFIFILTPNGVEISGDIQDILNEAAPNIRTEF